MRILLIEDDGILSDRLVASLRQHQYVVDAIADGQEGMEYAQSAPYDLIIADVGLPNLDGITLCQKLRDSDCATPILLMTAKDAPEERIRGLDAGADDHLTKPLNLEELHARVRALLRRGEVAPDAVLQAGPLQLDPASCQVTYAGNSLKITPKEYSLLELFLRSPNRVFSRAHIIEHLWSFDDPPLEDSVKAHIKGLRRKLKEAGAVDWIENVYGIGYRFTPQVAAAPQKHRAMESREPVSLASPAMPPEAPVEDAGVSQAFQTSMAGLWRKYHGLMTQRIDALTEAASAIQAGTLTPDLQAKGAQAAHKLAGILGMFEQDEGSDVAREIETLLETKTTTTLIRVPTLVQQLIQLIQVQPSEPTVENPAEPGYLLIVSPDAVLAESLQALEPTTQVSWKHARSLEDAETILNQSLPELAIVDIAAASMWASSLEFVQRLLAQNPSIPTIALAATDSLIDRVAIAQAGVQQLVPKPVTATQVWEIASRLHQKSRGVTAQILAVDDDPLILKALRYLLEPWGLGVTGLETPNHFWEVLNTTQPDLLILDVEMPDFSGIELCQAVRTDPAWQNLPVLFLTSYRDADTVQQIFRVGADDYISKPVVGPEVLTRILNRLERNRLMQTLARQDAVTGLPNQVYSQQSLSQLLASSLAQSSLFSLALIRLVDLPSINLHTGHEAGFAILQSWGQSFRGQLQYPERAGYWGHGEFVVGIPEMAQTEAREHLAPLLQILRRQIVTLPTGERIQPTFDWAIATSPNDGRTLQALYQFAHSQL